MKGKAFLVRFLIWRLQICNVSLLILFNSNTSNLLAQQLNPE